MKFSGKRRLRDAPGTRSGWRTYQASLNSRPSHRRRWISRFGPVAAGVLVLCILAALLSGPLVRHFRTPSEKAADAAVPADAGDLTIHGNPLAKADLHYLLDRKRFTNLTEPVIRFEFSGIRYTADTTLDMDLQRFILDNLDTRHSRYIGIVVVAADSGRVLSMVSLDKSDPGLNTCTDQRFPAASVFKVVSAAAVVETRGFDAQTRFKYNGGAHTLYKSQLRDRDNRYTRHISLKKAFADSVNPVFGKIGVRYLDKEIIATFSDRFGFNRHITFDIPLEPSRIVPSDDNYRRAELASGFNRETVISPLHGALIAASVVNDGEMMEPALVERVTDAEGAVLYETRPAVAVRCMSRETAAVLVRLMEETVRSGTGRKAFRRYSRDPVLSKLSIGGKTGSIDDADHEVRIDWFVGYAREKGGETPIALAAVVAHEDYIGTRAGDYARTIFTRYYESLFAKRGEKS